MADTDQEAKKMTSREASTMEESPTSESTLDKDVTMKDKGYQFNKGGHQPLLLHRISRSPGKWGGSGVVHMGGGIQNQKQCGQLSPWSLSSSSSGKSGGSGYRSGRVQHDVLQSPDHNTVHVIYGHTKKHFVHSELTEELKTRTGLQLVPPQSRVATSSSTADSFLIVIVGRHDSVTDRLLRQAVETSGHTDSHTLFIQTGNRCPDWVVEKLPRFLMIYPRCEEDDLLYDVYRQSSMSAGASTERTLFWDNLSTMIGDPHMDPTHRAMLNEFGLVQHAAFQSPDHNTVHVIYGHTNKHFVHSELTEELKTRTGLQLVPPQSRVATLSFTADRVLIVIKDRHDSVTDRLLRQAMETSGHPDTHTLFIQTGYRRPDFFVEEFPSCPVMICPEPEIHHPSYVLHRQSSVSAGASSGLKDVRTLFWDNVSTMIGASNMDPTDRAILNEFGLVQHDVLQSPHHNTVHVIYGNDIDTKRSLHSELIEELKTRTGLQLMLSHSRVATSSSTADSALVVIVDSNDSVTDRWLREAVETSGHTDTHTLFIQKGYRCPDWVVEKLPRFLMIYPGASTERKYVRTLFWDNVSTMIGDPHMNPTHRVILNDFGLVHHAVLQSPDHNTVHVIYAHTNKHFVHSELTEELKTRTGLQLVPPQSRVATSSSTADSVLIVIVDRHDSLTGRLLLQAVETSGHPDTNTLIIQKGDYRPDWVEEKLPRCTLMSYRRPEMRHPSYVLPRQSSVSAGASTGCKDVRTLFWDNVLTIIDDKSRHSRGSSDASVDSTVEDKTMSQHDLCANSKSETAMSTKIPQTSDKDSGHENNIFVDSTHDTKDKPTFLARDTDKKGSVTTVSTQAVDKAVCNKPKEGGAYAGHKSPPDAENAAATHISLSRPDSGLVAGSSSDAVPEIYSQVRLSNATTPKEEAESTCVTSQPTWENDGIDIPPPIVSMCWHYNGTFHSEGGVLRKPGSDVILHVPPGAVNTDNPVVIHTAVCADVDRVHNVLGLSDEEQVVSPLVEYWAGPDFSFERPVCITLPLCLPPDPDLSLLRVYRVSRRQDGHLSVNLVKPKVDEAKGDAHSEADSNRSNRLVSLSNIIEKEQKHDVTEYAQTSSDESRPEASVLNEANLDHSEAAFHQDRLLSDERAFFRVTSKGQVIVTTDCFSGYGCAYCGRNQGPPVLIAMVNGSLEKTPERTLWADVDLYVWDKRIEVADFREEYKIRIDTTQFQGTAVGLLKELPNTNFYGRLTVLGPSAQHWTHLTTADGQIGNPVIQERDLESVLACDAYGCSRRRSAPPLLVQWNLMAPAALMSESTMRMTINLSHVMSGVDPTWKDNVKIERNTSMTFKTEMPGEPNAEQWRPQLSELDTGQLERVVESLNMGLSERLHRKSRHDDGHGEPETNRQYMVDMCCRQDAAKVRSAIFALIHHLEQQLTIGQSAAGQSSPSENGASHSNQPPYSPDGQSGEDDISCSPVQRRRADMSTVRESADAPVSDSSNALVWDSSNALVWDSSTACVPRDSADSQQLHPSISEERVAKPRDHNSRTQMVIRVTETRKEMTVRGTGVGPPVSLTSMVPGLPGQASLLALMEPVPDAVFKHVDKPIILCVSNMLSPTGAMHFFVNLGLTHDQYNKAIRKRDNPEEAYLECFILLGRCRNTEINVEKLVKALEGIERYDIVEEVNKIQKKTVATVSTCE